MPVAPPMRLLIVKTSSLGDVIHQLPAITDMRRALPRAEIDWVVEEGYADIPALHQGVASVIPVAVRRWRSALGQAATWREIAAFRDRVRSARYDAVIDSQGLLKSAMLAAAARGPRHGYDRASAREPLAALFYGNRHRVDRGLHAIERNRRLAAAALGYALEGGLDYGLWRMRATFARSAPRTVGLLTASSRDAKRWPEPGWVALGRALHERGLAAVLPAGSEAERARASRIAAQIPGACVLPPSSLASLAALLAGCEIVVGVDTGLTHLAAAVGRPVLALYCDSEPGLTGVQADAGGGATARNLGGRGAPPPLDAVLDAARRLLAEGGPPTGESGSG
ncbi:MAG: lipopolysaccharide heptosyltransferase I [Burkholderiales bacterium]